jgi:cell division protein FtsN
MGRARGRGAAVGAALKSLFFGSALVGVGVCLGVVLGTVWDLPELLMRRLLETPRTVSLSAPEPGAGAEPLAAFRELQSKTRRTRPPAPTAPEARAPALAAPPESAERRVERPPAPAPERPSATDRVLADVAARAASRSAGDRDVVIQVASYTDRRSAEALVTRLRRAGFDSYLSHTRPEGEVRYRVRVRPGGGQGASELASELQSSGFSTWITTE